MQDEEDFLWDCTFVHRRVVKLKSAPFQDVLSTSSWPMDEENRSFDGLPTTPVSIYHTGDLLPLPFLSIDIQARPICNHKIVSVWHERGQRIYKFFDSIGLKWTTIDVVRFILVEPLKETGKPGSLFLWVGVIPQSLSKRDAGAAAVRCKEILADYEISNVEIAFRESVFTRSIRVGPQLLDPLYNIALGADEDVALYSGVNPTDGVHIPFTPALGLQIAPRAIPHTEGTGCLYLRQGGEHDRVLLLTARHVVLPLKYGNDLYDRINYRETTRRLEVIQLGSKAFQAAFDSILCRIAHQNYMIFESSHDIEELGEGNDETTVNKREAAKVVIAKRERLREKIIEFHTRIARFWGSNLLRVLGQVLYAPPISVGNDDNTPYSEDWAVVELDDEKIDWNTFPGNAIHLGRDITPDDFEMHPDEELRATKFRYPDGLMHLQGTLKEGELRSIAMPDANDEEYILLVKNGTSTGPTMGRASGVESFVREYGKDGNHSTFMAIAVYPYEFVPFSAAGDSGAVVADANTKRIVGMLIGGAGKPNRNEVDVSYVTPYHSVEKSIKKIFPDSYLYPTTS
ncbi:hypothetical protein BDN70DRAFT_870939 [Pholiota conissans]|uniref:Uncharacterized protein n=1 Tax=Pholiota conissans TaxID=109636 RepID=A0A9P5ZGV0_9AGAR|nr:hypothetical protein BDN70DRAFT_870939 [Pholiota conissans]